jgi:hypothetical protein
MYMDENGEPDIEGIYDALVNADVVVGPPELYGLVEELFPHLLHKVQPPLSRMH